MRDYRSGQGGGSQVRWEPRSRAKDEMVYGIHPVLEELKSGREIERIIVRAQLRADQLSTIASMARHRGIPLQHVPPQWFARLGNRNHQGIVAVVSPIVYERYDSLIPFLFEQGESPLIVVADGITDVRNLGAIARTAECAGAHALLVPSRGSAQIGADAVKASAGALNHIAVSRASNLHAACRFLQQSGLRLVAASEKQGTYYNRADLTGPLALILGDESEGISPNLAELADETVKIPMHGKLDSLNVSVSAGVLLYEIERQRHL